MIEMRWLIRNGWDGPESVLQYRQLYDATVYAGMGPFDAGMISMQWSEWKNVPEVKDE